MNPLEARRRLLGRNVYKRTTEGNPAIAQGSLARRYPGITMQGWTEQESTTGAQLFDENTVLKDVVIEQDGTLSRGIGYYTSDFIKINPSTTYHITYTGSKRGKFFDENKQPIKTDTYSDFNPEYGTMFVTPTNAVYIRFSGLSNGIQSVMLNEGSSSKPWEPYTGGAPSPSPDYPQEIVNAGKYNEDTQKWEFEITIANEQTDPDKNQTVTLTSDRPLTKWDKLEKRNGRWGWAYKSNEVVLDGSEDENWILAQTDNYNQFYIRIDTVEHLRNKKQAYCKKFRPAVITDRETEKEIIYTVRAISGAIAVSTELATEIDTWKTWLQSNPITVLYKSIEETFVPLTESEQEAMNTLHTFRPTTVLSNDCDCNMTLTYKTKKSLEVPT